MVADLIAVLKTSQSIAKFLQGDAIAEALADLGLEAAIAALGRAPRAYDRRAQIWSAVNHLEQAETAIKILLTRRQGSIWFLASDHATHLTYKRQYILCLLAACCKYLQEHELMLEALSLAAEPENIMSGAFWRLYKKDPTYSASDINLARLLRYLDPKSVLRYQLDVEAYRTILVNLPKGTLPAGPDR